MKQGFNGYSSGCCCPFEIYGFSCVAPNLFPASVLSSDKYFADGDVGLVVLPEVENSTDLTWTIQAARVPSSYPYMKCSTDAPPKSSADPTATCEDSWSVEFSDVGILAGERIEYEEDSITKYMYTNIHNVFSSRVIFVDSEERYVTYAVTPQYVAFETLLDRYPNWDAKARVKDHIQIDMTTNTPTLYNAQELGEPASTTLMQDAWISGMLASSVGNLGNVTYPLDDSFMYPCNWTYYGKDYFVVSSYSPGATDWYVGRLTYDGLVPFCNDSIDPQSGAWGDYKIVLPSVRAFLQSSVSQPDEPWVCAFDDITTPTKIVTGRWLNNDMRGLSLDPDNDVADGTLSEDDVENVIIDTADSQDPAVLEFDTETWANIEIRCYQHINGKDYMVFSSSGDEQLVTMTADFEDGDINSGLEGGLTFTAGGNYPGNTWLPDTGDKHGGTWSLKSNINAIIESQADLSIDINPPAVGYLTFWYIHDNRYAGTRIPPFTELTNFPDPENTLNVFIDGGLVPIEIWNGSGWDSYDKSRIDNINVPFTETWDEAHYLTWRQARISVPAGLHTIRWSLFRRFACDNGHLYSYIDDIVFPEITLNGDPESKRMWIYDGEKVIKVPKWAYAKRHDENEDGYYSRTSPLPDYITADFDGNIYYGNPHYTAKLKAEDSSLDTDWGQEGIITFSASPYITVPDGYYNGECEWIAGLPGGAIDNVIDPPWGAFQILPTKCGLQLRGVNGTMRDATHDPLGVAGMYPDEQFIRKIQATGSGSWNQRIHGWTICSEGKSIVPHLEVIWRPYKHEVSWPFEPNPSEPLYDTPPYSEYVESDGTDIPSWPASFWVDVHNPEKLNEDDLRSRWTRFNYIVSRVYADVHNHTPQYKWTKNPADDPEPTIGPDPNPAYYEYPWPRGEAASFFAWHCPTQGHFLTMDRALPPEVSCEVILNETPEFYYIWRPRINIGGISDFDAVYNSCSCLCCGDRETIERREQSA